MIDARCSLPSQRILSSVHALSVQKAGHDNGRHHSQAHGCNEIQASLMRRAIWLCKLLQPSISISTPQIHVDDKSALKLLKNPVSSNRVKHIDQQCHFAGEKMASWEISSSLAQRRCRQTCSPSQSLAASSRHAAMELVLPDRVVPDENP